jgi:hypothetical protein
MSKIERVVIFESGIIEGEVVRELQGIFKELNESFKQRKTYDEYYYTTARVTVNISQIDKLNELYYKVLIDSEYMLITY